MGEINCGCGIPNDCGRHNSGGCGSIIWIILILSLCNNGGDSCGGGSGLSGLFGGDGDGCGCIIIILLLLCCCGGNSFC